jgi:beta-lactamase regulating signal transducer with metallopeptidase domain
MILNFIAESNLIEHLGWTLAHSIWQIALASVALLIVLRLSRPETPNRRYAVSVAALALAVAMPVATFVKLVNESDKGKPAARLEQVYDRQEFDPATQKIGQTAAPTDNKYSYNTTAETNVFQPLAGLRQFLNEQIPPSFPFLVGLWLFGVALFSLKFAGGFLYLRQIKTTGIESLDGEWQLRFENLCRKLGVSPAVNILRSNIVGTPIAAGVFRPLIIIPASVFLQMDPRQLESIVAHELIHIRRFDPLVNLAQSAVEILFFYHPATWWISRVVRREREFAADAAVMEAIEDGGVVYATALANLEEVRLSANNAAASIATAANGGNLMQRIQRILNNKTEIPRASSAWPAGLAIALISALLLSVFSFTPKALVNAENTPKNRKLAIGFVGIPPLDRTANPPKDSDATARLLIAKLQQYKIPAVGFVTGGMISDGEKLFPVRANIVRLWRDAGLEVGIGNFKHIWFYNTPYDEFVANVEKNEMIVRRVLGEKKLPLRFYSYPYLNTGKSVEERDRFENWLGERGLKSVKYTIDNQEWMYSYAYDAARNDNDINTMTAVRVAFIKYMDKMFDHYEAYSQEMFGRDIPQTMVLTPSRLVADSADELFGMIRNRGYTFVPIDEALSDEAYRTPETMVGQFGNSWFERWYHTQGKKLRDEPEVDTDVMKAWKARAAK